ncbi:hypothetical protein MTO96_047762 [Rhipicephalus appendiculatus]
MLFCNFALLQLQEPLRDRLIARLRSDTVQCRLLALPNDEVTWDRVCEVDTAMEAAQKDTQDMLFVNAGASNAELHCQGSQVKPTATNKMCKTRVVHAVEVPATEQDCPIWLDN